MTGNPLKKVTILFLFTLIACSGEDLQENTVSPVSIYVVETSIISETVNAPCRLEGASEAIVSVSVPSVVEEVLVSPGDTVLAGQRLLILRTDDMQRAMISDAAAMLTAARASAEYADGNLQRATDLLESGAMSAGDYERIETEGTAARATYNQALAGYNASSTVARNGFVLAPFSGVIGRVIATEGNPASGPLMSVYSTDVIEAELLVAPRHIHKLRAGLPSVFTTDHFPGIVFPGSVVSVSETADAVSGLVAMTVQFSDTTGSLIPGLSGVSMLLLSTSDSAIVLPSSMMTPIDESTWEIFVLENGHATRRVVQSGLRNGTRYEIIEGLAVGDSVINLGHTLLSEGSPVRVVQ